MMGKGVHVHISFPKLDSPPHFSYHPQPPSPGTAWQRPPRTPTSSPSPQRAQRAQRFSNPPLSPLVTAMPNLSRNSSMSPIFRTPGLIQRIRPRPSYSISRPKMPVKMSPELVNKFIEVSTDNSFIGVETGAILGGFISANKSFYVVDHLFIPDQIGYSTSYSDTDSTTCGLLMLQSNRQNLGTIHTHQGHLKSFMSSVDLHMHSLIQKDCNSAIALVHSPRYSTTPSYTGCPKKSCAKIFLYVFTHNLVVLGCQRCYLCLWKGDISVLILSIIEFHSSILGPRYSGFLEVG